jgi:hypothetical protein
MRLVVKAREHKGPRVGALQAAMGDCDIGEDEMKYLLIGGMSAGQRIEVKDDRDHLSMEINKSHPRPTIAGTVDAWVQPSITVEHYIKREIEFDGEIYFFFAHESLNTGLDFMRELINGYSPICPL